MATYRAAVAVRTGKPDVFEVQERPVPSPKDGWVTIQVHAAGFNRAELFTRQGDSPGVEFPRVLGIECAGVVTDNGGSSKVSKGDKVCAIMGGMGRQFDGGYAEYTQVPERCVFPVKTSLSWEVLGALPEMFQTTQGSLTRALNLQAGQTVLIRGGTSSIGLLAAKLAKRLSATVVSTTRNPAREATLLKEGADHVIIDTGDISSKVKELIPGGVHAVLDLVGTTTLIDSLQCARHGGTVCMTGILGGKWTFDFPFAPMSHIPSTVKLTAYSGGPEDLDASELQSFVEDYESGRVSVKTDRTWRLDEISDAHRFMEDNSAVGKMVLVMQHE